MADIKAWFSQDYTGTIETAVAPFWRSLPDGIPTVVIRRPVDDVMSSLVKLGLSGDIDRTVRYMRYLDGKLNQIERRRVPGVLSVQFSELAREDSCAAIFEHCLTPYQHDRDWWARLAPINLQINIASLMRYMRAYQEPLASLVEISKRATLMGMRPRKTVEHDGVTIQQESCEDWFRDGKKLFEEHSVILGEPPHDYLKRNWKLMETMDHIGAMQIMTARCNGRMVGYHVSYVAPATDDASILSSLQISIFVSKDFSGLASRLQRVSIEALKQKGVGEVCFRAGVKGDGARMAAIYKRSGAEYMGQMYRLSLKAE